MIGNDNYKRQEMHFLYLLNSKSGVTKRTRNIFEFTFSLTFFPFCSIILCKRALLFI